ncbi:MAG: ferrous iron transport protein A [Clostridia bacterium]|nr:ferrous iron transport protein A [Clostridia bacterium]
MIHLNELCLLSQLSEGEIGIVNAINVTGSMRRRLQDLGLIRETEIKCLFRNVKGNLGAYNIRDAVIALRNSDTSRIEVIRKKNGA